MDNVSFEIEEVDRLKLDTASGKTRMILKPDLKERASIPRRPKLVRTVASMRDIEAKVSPEQRAMRAPRSPADGRETSSTPSR